MQNQAVPYGRKKLFSFVPYATDICYNTNEQLIEEMFNGEKIPFKVPMTRATKVSFQNCSILKYI